MFVTQTLSSQARLFKSLKLWSYRADLEESLGDVNTTKAVYDAIFELKIANAQVCWVLQELPDPLIERSARVQVVVNYATFLEENDYFEESFKVYERALDAFSYPIKFELLNAYLAKFVKRFGGTKMERARDLFEEAVSKCPPKFAKSLFLMYGKLEEEHGLAKRAMRVYEMAVERVDKKDQFEVGKARLQCGLLQDAIADSPLLILGHRRSKCWWQRQQNTLVCLPRALCTSALSRSCRTRTPQRCVFALLLWSASSAKSTEPELFTPMALNSVTPESIPSTGKLGTPSSSTSDRKTLSERCAGSRSFSS